jgi:hypothetical protein
MCVRSSIMLVAVLSLDWDFCRCVRDCADVLSVMPEEKRKVDQLFYLVQNCAE